MQFGIIPSSGIITSQSVSWNNSNCKTSLLMSDSICDLDIVVI
jgi:hypothetical protein